MKEINQTRALLLDPAGGLLSAKPLTYILYENKPTPSKPINPNSNATSKMLQQLTKRYSWKLKLNLLYIYVTEIKTQRMRYPII